jgi:hypothetical protein
MMAVGGRTVMVGTIAVLGAMGFAVVVAFALGFAFGECRGKAQRQYHCQGNRLVHGSLPLSLDVAKQCALDESC